LSNVAAKELIASRLHFTPPSIAHTLCAWRETDWGEGITTTTLSLHLLFICRVSRFALFTHSSTPLAVFFRRRPLPQTVQIVIMWTVPLTDHIASGVTAKKTITRYRYYPIYSNIAQFPI